MEAAIIGLAGVIVGVLLNELLSLLRMRGAEGREQKRNKEVLNELLRFVREIQSAHSDKHGVWTYGHTSRIPKILLEEIQQLRKSGALSPAVTVELMFVQQGLVNLDENLRSFYEEKLKGGDRVQNEAELVAASASSLSRMLDRVENVLDNKA